MMNYDNYDENPRFRHLTQDLLTAFHRARRHKRSTEDEFNFELNCEENILRLAASIMTRTYVPSRGIAFITYNPVIREIFAAPFRDRVVHHYIYNKVYPWWDRHFIPDSYSCREGRGTDYAIRRLYRYMRKVSCNFQRPTCVIEMDVQGYFMSLPHRQLYERALWGLKRQYDPEDFEFRTLKFLWRQVIFDHPTDGVEIRGSRRRWPKRF